MIQYFHGDIFTTSANAIVVPVNIVGAMGKGLAAQAKAMSPQMYATYRRNCDTHKFKIGNVMYFKGDYDAKIWVLIPTKVHYHHHAKPEIIEAGLQKFCDTYNNHGITSVAFPKLGCGLGTLDFSTEVQPIMEKYLANLPIPCYIYI